MKISYIFPSMSRPAKFFATLENIKENALLENYEVVCLLEESDATMNNLDVISRIAEYEFAKPFFITSTGKINAINQGLNYISPDYDIMILIADDIVFTQKGFDCIIDVDMQQNFPNLDGLLHYPDGISHIEHRQITMPVMGKKLVDSFGYIYHPDYISVWCDNHQLAVVQTLKKHIYLNKKLFVHNHPAWGKGQVDDLYRKNESFYSKDSETYFKHLANNFGI